MKIGLDPASATPSAPYARRLAELLAKYAPQHRCVTDARRCADADLYHGSSLPLPLATHLHGILRVVTVADLDFLRHPHRYSLLERLVLLRLCRFSCRRAHCIITLDRAAKEELARRLGIDTRKIRVVPPLAACPPDETRCTDAECEHVRRKFGLPRRFVLADGVCSPHLNPLALLDALIETDAAHAVFCGRHTPYADFLLGYARAAGLAARTVFIYESTPGERRTLLRMADALVCTPDTHAEASIRPAVEAMRAGTPLILSDRLDFREAAAEAALYVTPGSVDDLVRALRTLRDGALRERLVRRERERAALFDEEHIVRRLNEIYASLRPVPTDV